MSVIVAKVYEGFFIFLPVYVLFCRLDNFHCSIFKFTDFSLCSLIFLYVLFSSSLIFLYVFAIESIHSGFGFHIVFQFLNSHLIFPCRKKEWDLDNDRKGWMLGTGRKNSSSSLVVFIWHHPSKKGKVLC